MKAFNQNIAWASIIFIFIHYPSHAQTLEQQQEQYNRMSNMRQEMFIQQEEAIEQQKKYEEEMKEMREEIDNQREEIKRQSEYLELQNNSSSSY